MICVGQSATKAFTMTTIGFNEFPPEIAGTLPVQCPAAGSQASALTTAPHHRDAPAIGAPWSSRGILRGHSSHYSAATNDVPGYGVTKSGVLSSLLISVHAYLSRFHKLSQHICLACSSSVPAVTFSAVVRVICSTCSRLPAPSSPTQALWAGYLRIAQSPITPKRCRDWAQKASMI